MAVHARLFSIILLLLHHVSYGLGNTVSEFYDPSVIFIDASSAVDNLPPISPSIPASYYASQTRYVTNTIRSVL